MVINYFINVARYMVTMRLNRNNNSMNILYFVAILFTFAHFTDAQDTLENDSIKTKIIREIMKKAYNITLNKLSNLSPVKKQIALDRIEEKLTKSGNGLPHRDKYIKHVMEEFKRKADNTEKTTKEPDQNKKVSMKEKIPDLQSSKKSFSDNNESLQKIDKVMNSQTKQNIVTDIANKIENMAKVYLKKSQSLDEKKIILQKIERRIVESSKRKQMDIHSQHKDLKEYADFIAQGLQMSMNRLLSDTRRVDGTVAIKNKNNTMLQDTHEANMGYINQYKLFISDILNDTSFDPACEGKVSEMCLRIGSLHKLSCGDENVISLEKLCDAVPDCLSSVDELNCIPQVAEKVQLAIPLMSDIEQSMTTNCMQSIIDAEALSRYHQVLREMMKSQVEFLQNDTISTKSEIFPVHEKDDKQDANAIYLKQSISYLAKTVVSLSLTLEETLCFQEVETKQTLDANILTRKSLDNSTDDFVDYDNSQQAWTPKSCSCTQQYCTTSDCDNRCNNVCWQKYILNHFPCQSITGEASISLNEVCDGKLDCFDESDEALCTTDLSQSKYEANDAYKYLLEVLSLKSLSVEYKQSRNKIIEMINLVHQLQQLTTKPTIDIHAVNIHRKQFFKLLTNIYGDMMLNSNLEELDRNHRLLILLNQKMVYALKRSHTGNENVVLPTGCYCRNGTCAHKRCTPKCVTTCQFEPMFTTYSCKANNVTVPLKYICNGKKDCPNDEDEKDCIKDVCRSHHLRVLRNNLQKTKVKDHALGEILGGWKSKVTASLIVAESGDRPNHKMIEDIIHNILRDLVTAYASIDAKKIKTETVLNEFKSIYDIALQTLKSCWQ